MKSVRQTFSWNTIDGRPFVTIEDWLQTLSRDEQEEFKAARNRQDLYRQQAIDAGLMVRDPTGDYIWRDPEAAEQGKGTNDVWYNYFQRWLSECGIMFETKFIKD